MLGIDIGTSVIKLVELSCLKGKQKLENYGELAVLNLYEKPFRTLEKNTLLLSTQEIARAIKAILQEANIKTKEANFTIPDFSTFFTSFELPAMTKEEIPQAVQYTARRHVPLPLSEVTLDWQIIPRKEPEVKGSAKSQIILVSVPNHIVDQYKEIAVLSNLNLLALEAEAFSLARAAIKDDDKKKVIVLVDIGARSTSVSVIDNAILKSSYSFDVSGNEFTALIAKSLDIDYKEAESFKKKHGLVPLPQEAVNMEKEIGKILTPFTDLILSEVEKISQQFYRSENKRIEKIILAGGSALLPGFKDCFTDRLGKETIIVTPFSNIFYPPILDKTIKGMGSSFAIATGAALRGLGSEQ